ncbi:MAG: nicotinamide riboside transporter PnuC [Bacteroidota bacterium]
MGIQDWVILFIGQIKETSFWEWIAVVLAIAEVLLAWRNSVWLYPAGIISTALYIYLMAAVHLYAESVLNVYYLIMSIYGWLLWVKRKEHAPIPITHNSPRDWWLTTAIVAASWAILYIVLRHYTDSTVPLWDAWVSATAWAGMWLLAKRKVENWILLNISNLFAIPLQIYKKLPLTSCLTLFLFIVAIFGYYEWKKKYQIQITERA